MDRKGKGIRSTDFLVDRAIVSPSTSDLEGKEPIAGETSLSWAIWLKKRTAPVFGTVGADVMVRLTPIILRLQGKYKSAPDGPERLIVSLQFKAAVYLHHLAFKITKRAKQFQLRNAGIDEVVLEIERQLRYFSGRDRAAFSGLEDLPELFGRIDAAADEVDDMLGRLKRTIKIHWKTPCLDANDCAAETDDD